ncbi:MAG: DUF3106 domain-containing protein [Planctomycetes bacterium]|nr:DUF3106 domain-containing protein [Planctomycetota bacterium]
MKPFLLLAFTFSWLALVPVEVSAQDKRPAPAAPRPRPQLDPAKLERWKALPQERRTELLARWQRLKAMQPEARVGVFQNAREWRNLSPEKRRAILEKMKGLPAEQRARLLQRMERNGQPPGPRQEMVRNLAGMMGRLSPEERQRIRKLLPPERLQMLQRMVEEHYLQSLVLGSDERTALLALPPEKRWRRIKDAILQRVQHKPGEPGNPRSADPGAGK